jgi:hypothetical protein
MTREEELSEPDEQKMRECSRLHVGLMPMAGQKIVMLRPSGAPQPPLEITIR